MRFPAALAAAFPLLPDPDEAREWAERELADPAYEAAEPNVVDRIAQAVGRFLGDLLRVPDTSGWGPSALIVLAIVIAALIVVAVLIWGRPRLVSRATRPAHALFDEDDTRSADDLRADAARAAARADWDEAIVLRFRAFARGLTERGLVDPPPGATVRAFCREAAGALPTLAGPLDEAAEIFDDVRYLRRPGSADRYRAIADLDDQAVRARPTPAAAP
ncbi:hypothetical protein FHS07_000400 [Microbacterium proteolyticum]|uniref:Protein-glutamine gamma-glutamyltransferase-like C-terminal domain-containing protein n=1 Tax=Microbacterium proteolyticum TaxID=1572644 RepID=A0A7W5GE75_9MICO|nr:DUF4129 domain-containing protein [Microbacterium proteolyticum]MBB3156716.1 hypothetical protein [Microbacterium proteolyticum]